MKVEVKVTKEVNITYLKVRAGVRYWEDAEVDGVELNEDGDGLPCKDGDSWCPLIEIETGKIVNWEIGKTAKVHFKVCDDGDYWLLDRDKNEILHKEGYVPSILDIERESYGDYIIMSIDENGVIANWSSSANVSDFYND